MEKRFARRTRETVLPGDVLADADEFRAGEGAYELGGKIRAEVLGTKTAIGNAVGVIPSDGRYMPETGDTVIGVICNVGPSTWMVDINAPYPAPLHVSEVPWKVEFGDTVSFLTMEDVVLLKVLSVDETRKISVTMKDSGLRKIEGGQLVEIGHNKISRVIGRGGSMIQMLKDMTDCRITVGRNGRIWIDGENASVAAAAIEKIGAEARSANLTERIGRFIEDRLPQSEYTEKEESE